MTQVWTQEQNKISTVPAKKIFLSVVIPAYNESESLPWFLQELQEIIAPSPWIEDYEIWVIDDHSTDGTFQLIRSLANPKIRGVRLNRRSGSHIAIRAGLDCAQGNATLCLSADGQDNPQILNEMLKKLEAGAHIVWGVRQRREESWISRFFARAAYRLISLMVNSNISQETLSNADFYLLSKKAVEAIKQCPERHTSLFGLILWLGFKQDFVRYERRPRKSGESKWSFHGRLRLLADWVIAFSGIPLKLISFFGMLTATLGFFYAFFVLGYTLLGYAKPGWAETVFLILILGGAQMMMLGVIGEYLWRTLDETRSRPLFFIEDRTDQS